MGPAESERVAAAKRLLRLCSLDVTRMVQLLKLEGITCTKISVAMLWYEFSVWWVAIWLPLPHSDAELLHILLRGMRKRSLSEKDWDLACLDKYYAAGGNCRALPVRWDVTPDEFDMASTRLLNGGSWNHHLARKEICALIAQKHFVGSLEPYREFESDLAKVRLVASAYWFPVGRLTCDGYPK